MTTSNICYIDTNDFANTTLDATVYEDGMGGHFYKYNELLDLKQDLLDVIDLCNATYRAARKRESDYYATPASRSIADFSVNALLSVERLYADAAACWYDAASMAATSPRATYNDRYDVAYRNKVHQMLDYTACINSLVTMVRNRVLLRDPCFLL